MDRLALHIGCGGTHLVGYINLDIVDEKGAADELIDCSDILKIHPEWKGKVYEIVSYHFLEHLDHGSALRALRQFYELLVDGGDMILELPDFEYLCSMVTKGNTDDLTMSYIFGSQVRDGQFHKWGWTPASLKEELVKAGFKKVRFMKPQDYHAEERPCFRLEAIK